MWQIIVEEEYERFLEAVENCEINTRMRFCDCGDFEDEFSHNEIHEAARSFFDKASNHISESRIAYRARYGVDCVFVEKV